MVENQGQRRSRSFQEQMISFMGENKRLLNIHEQMISILGKHNCVSGQHKCLFAKSGDISRVASPSNVEPVKGCLPK